MVAALRHHDVALAAAVQKALTLRKVKAAAMAQAMAEHGVTHCCGAPIVHSLLVNAPSERKAKLPRGVKATG